MDILNVLVEEVTKSKTPVVKQLYNVSGKKLLAIGLDTGVLLKEHVAPGKAKLMVVQGVIDFHISEKNYRLSRFDHFDIPRGIIHSVTGMEEAIFLLMVDIEK